MATSSPLTSVSRWRWRDSRPSQRRECVLGGCGREKAELTFAWHSRSKLGVLADLEAQGKAKMIGAMYNASAGAVEFLA